MKSLVVMASGGGSNLQAILEACDGGRLSARVAAVFSDKPDAYALERARHRGLPALVRPFPKGSDRRLYDAQLAASVEEYRPDFVVLAGWMRLLSSAFLDRFPRKVINLHPALPGQFPGVRAIQRAYEAGVSTTGVMIHLVPDEGVDNGPVLACEEVPRLPEDTLEALEARIHAVEHRLLVDTLQGLCS